jgi:dTDP-4-dehydrorhamnose 3,5-epimerase
MEPKIINGGVATDDRGSVRFVNEFNFDGVKRFYQVQNHRAGFIRAWHGHHKEGKYVYVAKGTAIIGAVPIDMMIEKNIDQSKVVKTVLSSNNP